MSPFIYFLALFHTISLLTPLLHSTTLHMLPTPTPTPIPSNFGCSVLNRTNCLLFYSNNVSMFSDSNFSAIFTQFCEISQPVSSPLCIYTEGLVSCVTNNVSQLIISGTNSRSLDSSAKSILQICSALSASTLPLSGINVFASTINSINFYGYYINQGIFTNSNISTRILREINSLCVSTVANSSIIDESTLNDYITSLNVSNLTEILCTGFCPVCETRLIGSLNDDIIAIDELCIAISSTSLVSNCLCGDGRLSIGETCDDGNRENSDGCTNMCIVESNWICIENANGLSECSNCGNNMKEFREECDHNFPGCDSCEIAPLFNCAVLDPIIGITNCTYVLLDTNTSDPFSVNSEYLTSLETFRLDMNLVNVGEINSPIEYRLIFSRLDNPEIISDSNPISLNIEALANSLGLSTLSIQPNFTSSNTSNVFITTYMITQEFLDTFKSNSDFRGCLLAFINFTQVDLSNRPVGSRVKVEIQIEVRDSQSIQPPESIMDEQIFNITFSSANITITSLGTDDSRPVITLGDYNPIFYEGNDSIPIVSPLSTVSDVNDLFYPIQSLTVTLSFTGESDFAFESVSILSLPENFTSTYDTARYELVVTGPGQGSEYTSILRSIVYLNTLPEPTTGMRRISITARDTVDEGVTVEQFISVVNINDLPILTFSQDQVTYIENEGPIPLDVSLNITDMDVSPSVQTAYVELASIDADEVISFGTAQNIFAVNNTFLVVNSSQSVESVRDIFRAVTYQHLSDNPTSGTRVITFSLTDNNNGTIFTPFTVTVQPVNDAPVVEVSRTFFTYIEDSPPILIGDYITLTDVDSSNFSRIDIIIREIPFQSRYHDMFLFVSNPNITLTMDAEFLPGLIFTYTYHLMRNTPISDYQVSISSIRYNNTFEGDFIPITGNRSVEIYATDSGGERSQPGRLTIEIIAQNDPPILNLGSGLGQNWTFSFTEHNSSSTDDPSNEQHIVLLPRVDIFDEENHIISKLTIQLAISNRQLDPNEFIFVRSPLFSLFDNSSHNIIWYTTGTYMEFNGEASVLNYTNILKGIYYTNDENEPSLYAFGDRFLKFEVSDILGATSVLYTIIETIPINDNRPVLLLRLRPEALQSVMRQARETPESLTFKTLNATAFLEKEFVTEMDTLVSGDVIHIVFDSVMKTRNLAHQNQINSLLQFNLDVPNEIPKFSYWLDAKTLSIAFPRIDEKFKDRLTPLKHTNLSIIFKDCAVLTKQCINLCANKKQLTCAKGEIGVKIIANKQKDTKPIDEVGFTFLFWYIVVFLTFLLIFASILILIMRFCIKSVGKKHKSPNLVHKNVVKNGFKKMEGVRKTDEEQINSLKNRKYNPRKPKANPRSTPNIFKCVLGEN